MNATATKKYIVSLAEKGASDDMVRHLAPTLQAVRKDGLFDLLTSIEGKLAGTLSRVSVHEVIGHNEYSEVGYEYYDESTQHEESWDEVAKRLADSIE